MVSSSFNFPQFNSLIGLIYDWKQISSRDKIKGLPTGMTKKSLILISNVFCLCWQEQ